LGSEVRIQEIGVRHFVICVVAHILIHVFVEVRPKRHGMRVVEHQFGVLLPEVVSGAQLRQERKISASPLRSFLAFALGSLAMHLGQHHSADEGCPSEAERLNEGPLPVAAKA